MIMLAIPYGVYAVILTLPIQSMFTMMVNMYPNKKLLNYSITEQVFDLLLEKIRKCMIE